MLIKFKKAQSTAEYAILFSLVVGAALAMQVYIRRSIQAKMFDAGIALTSITGDAIGDIDGIIEGDYTLVVRDGSGEEITQYEPYYKVQGISENKRRTFLDRSTFTGEGGFIDDESKQTAAIGSGSAEASHVVDINPDAIIPNMIQTVEELEYERNLDEIEIPTFQPPPSID